MLDVKCSDCDYYQPTHINRASSNGGECRKNPPIVFRIYDYDEWEFPYVTEDYWCGQFKHVNPEDWDGGAG